jgi:hypothetical protein
LETHVISVDSFRSFVGKCVSISNIIVTWRPFINVFWGALIAVGSSRAGAPPPGCLWLEQVNSSLIWILSFLAPDRNPDFVPELGIRRTWTLSSYLSIGAHIAIVFDASPYGLGALLVVDDKIEGYIESRLTHVDAEVLQQPLGAAEGQQMWECLICPVAIRAWKSRWQKSRVNLSVKGDNLSALNLAINLRVKGHGPILVAKEMALELADGSLRRIPSATSQGSRMIPAMPFPNVSTRRNVSLGSGRRRWPEFPVPTLRRATRSTISLRAFPQPLHIRIRGGMRDHSMQGHLRRLPIPITNRKAFR